MITDEEVAILDEFIRLDAWKQEWREIKKKLFLLYLPYLTNNRAAEIFSLAPSTVRQHRSDNSVESNIDIWKHPPPLIHPETAVLAAKMFITGQLTLFKISKKLEVPLLELEKLLKPKSYKLGVHHARI